jgi:hypothetical protein
MGLRVVRDDGGPIGFRHALVRGATGAFVERPGVSFFVVAAVTSLVHPRDKRLGDVLAGTVVIRERVSVRGGSVAQMPPPLAGWAAGLDLSGLGDDLALSVRQFLSRSAQMTPQARDDLGGRLLGAVLQRISPPPPPDTPGWAVLSAVLAERRRRDEQRLSARPPSGGTSAPSYERPGFAPTPRTTAADSAPEPEPERPPTPGPGGFVAPF